MKIGIISDTHGLIRPEAKQALAGCAAILHAGDIGEESVLAELEAIAPMHAVRGNIDSGAWARKYPATDLITLEGHHFYLIHDLEELDLDPVAAGVDVVISGHSHRPKIELRAGVLYCNPGSAGPRRCSLPIGVAHIYLAGGKMRAEYIELDVS
ncbi:MAG: metallophosphoesterase family protein [Gammaproteobacteria bacterium]|nr:metallophosphoesterase family protein [Gammaproteobacteria bacterium]